MFVFFPFSPFYFGLGISGLRDLQADKGVSVRSVGEHVLVELEHDVIDVFDSETLPYL